MRHALEVLLDVVAQPMDIVELELHIAGVAANRFSEFVATSARYLGPRPFN